MRISDWSSDVCSSDLSPACPRAFNAVIVEEIEGAVEVQSLVAPNAIGQCDMTRGIGRRAVLRSQDRLDIRIISLRPTIGQKRSRGSVAEPLRNLFKACCIGDDQQSPHSLQYALGN